MRVLGVHPGPLMYSKIFLRLEPLGLELVAAAVRQAGHEAAIIDLQVETESDYLCLLARWQPDVIAFSCNYLANVPEVVDLARLARKCLPGAFILVGGHSASFTARDILEHAEGAIDAVLCGEGEAAMGQLMLALDHDRRAADRTPGIMTRDGVHQPPAFVESLDNLHPARDLLRHRRKYFIGVLDPCASIEFSRGCPWDCSFCSAWTFYGRSYRTISPEKVVEDLERIREPGIFIVDDVAFIQAGHGLAIGEAIARKGIRKRYYLETRGDVLLRNKDVFRLWKRLGLEYMFIGLEAIDEDGLRAFRKRTTTDKNLEALEFARALGVTVAVNIIADPDWDRRRFEIVRQWCLEMPEIVNISVNTPYPGTETWWSESRKLVTRDYRLFDIQHAVLPTRLPLADFYAELVRTQRVLNTKHLGWAALRSTAGIAASHLLRGQTNFVRMLWKFGSVYDPRLQLADHERPVRYEMSLPPERRQPADPLALYLHPPQGRRGPVLDADTEAFVSETGRQAQAS